MIKHCDLLQVLHFLFVDIHMHRFLYSNMRSVYLQPLYLVFSLFFILLINFCSISMHATHFLFFCTVHYYIRNNPLESFNNQEISYEINKIAALQSLLDHRTAILFISAFFYWAFWHVSAFFISLFFPISAFFIQVVIQIIL